VINKCLFVCWAVFISRTIKIRLLAYDIVRSGLEFRYSPISGIDRRLQGGLCFGVAVGDADATYRCPAQFVQVSLAEVLSVRGLGQLCK